MQKAIENQVKSPFRRRTSDNSRPTVLRMVLRILRLGTNYSLESLKVMLPCSIFAYKFLEWWYSSSNIHRFRNLDSSTQEQGLYIKPPAALEPHPRGVLMDEGRLKPIPSGHCPLCRSVLVNSTAFPSGWVCCYKCAHSHVSEFGRCPVTWYPTVLADLRRIVG